MSGKWKFIPVVLVAVLLLCCTCACATPKDKILMFTGDSISDAGRAKTIEPGMFLGGGYVKTVNEKLSAAWGKDAPVILMSGVAGNTAKDILERFETDVDAFKPDVLVLLIGINDALEEWKQNPDYTATLYGERLTEIMERWAKYYPQVILITPFYIEDHSMSEFRRNCLDAYAEVVKDIAGKYSNIELIDAQEIFDQAMIDGGNPDNHRLLSVDRIHLSAQLAKELMSDAVINTIGW